MLPFIKKSYADIFEDFYNITNGDIILAGSLSLKMQGIIDRDINDIDLNISKSDWYEYNSQIIKKYKIYYEGTISLLPRLKYEYIINKCLNKQNKNEFHLFINNIDTKLEYNTIIYNNTPIRVRKPELVLLDKECMLLDDTTGKHTLDIAIIKKYLNEKKTTNSWG
jgi:hypothetical protein